MVRGLSNKGASFLQTIEQLRSYPYNDQTGFEIKHWVKGATIGYGHLIDFTEWTMFGKSYVKGIPECVANWLFFNDLEPFVEVVNKHCGNVKLNQNQFDALVILAFNIGESNFRNSSVVKILNGQGTDYDTLADAWKAWRKSQGKVMQGLINRRQAELNIYYNNVYEKW